MAVPSSQWPDYAKIDPEFEAVLKAMGPQPAISDAPDVPAARAAMFQVMEQLSKVLPAPDYSGVKKSNIEIPMRDGAKIPARLYQPDSGSGAVGPLVVLYHGGGFCIGIPEMEEPAALDVVKNHGAVAISVDYRMAPEHPFPAAIDDSFDALKWAAANASSFGADASKGFVIGGTSAGGAISASISHMARDEGLSPPLTGVWLNIPHVVGQSALPEKYRKEHTSFEQNANAPILGLKEIDFFMRYYKADDNDPKHSPLLWPGGHKELAPHLIQVSGMDPLRDDGLLYERELREQGVPTTLHVYQGVPHGFEGLFSSIGLAKKHVADREAGFASLLGH